MKQFIRNEYGYTLLEMLIVLFIVVVISSITFHFTNYFAEKREIDYFFFQLQLDIGRAQALATEIGGTVDVVFLDDNTYKIYHKWDEIILERKFPKNVQMNFYSKFKRIRFDSLGEVQEFGSVSFKTSLGDRHLIIYISKGRSRYVEG